MTLANIFGKKSIAAALAAAIATAAPGSAIARGDGGGNGGNGPSCCGSDGTTSNNGGHVIKQDQDLCFAIPQALGNGMYRFATFRAPQGLVDSGRPIPNTLGDVAFEGAGFQELLKNRSTPKNSGFLGMGGDKTPIINVVWTDRDLADAAFIPQCDEKLKGLVSEFGGYTPAPVVAPEASASKTAPVENKKPLVYFKGGVVKPQ